MQKHKISLLIFLLLIILFFAYTVTSFFLFETSQATANFTASLSFQSTEYNNVTNTLNITVFYMCLFFALILYLIWVSHRISNACVNRALTHIIILLMFFITLGLLKTLNTSNEFLESLIWYCLYIPIITIPAIFLFIALILSNFISQTKVKTLFKLYCILSFILLFLVFTNNFHNMVFTVNNYNLNDFTYNIIYYILVIWVALSVAFSYFTLMNKTIRSPKKLTFFYPLIASALLLFYVIANFSNFTYIKNFEVTFIGTILIVLFIEACIQSKIFPGNSGYTKLFMHSGLTMEIKDSRGKTAYKSFFAKDLNENFIKRQNKIAGGTFYYYEDYTSLNTAEKKLEEINFKMRKNNEFLLKNSKVNADLIALAAEKSVYDNIDNILQIGTQKIEDLIENMRQSPDKKRTLYTISMYACLMKRECMLRINALYQDNQPVPILSNSVAELKDFTQKLDLNITNSFTVMGDLPTVDILEMYRFFALCVEIAVSKNCSTILVQLYENEDGFVFSVLADKVLFEENEAKLISKKAQNYNFSSKDWDDTKSYLLVFKGGKK